MKGAPLCDPELLRERALNNDPHLVADIINCFRDDLERFLLHRCGHAGDADDAMQDAWESAIRYIDGYRGESSVKNWLYRLASSACVRMRRGQKNNTALHTSSSAEPKLTEAVMKLEQHDVEAMLEARLMPIRTTLEELQSTDRNILLLRDGQGLSTAETAELLALSESAVKSRLHRSRQYVRQRLEG